MIKNGKKYCPHCEDTKPADEFANNRRNPDGKAGWCKTCTYPGVRKYQREHPDKAAEYDRRWYEDNKDVKAASARRRRARNPERHRMMERARGMVERAVEAGKIIKSERCEECNRKAKLIGHHPDYSKPLEVKWVCFRCHPEEEHIELRKVS